MTDDDPRRRIPRTDAVTALPQVREAAQGLSQRVLTSLVRQAQEKARRGTIQPEEVVNETLAAVRHFRAWSMRPVLNATGIIIHTNLGRAPLSDAAREAVAEAAGYVDLEMDLASGARARRGAGAHAALLSACPEAEDALLVNNGAGALVLATTALAGAAEVVVSRGEMVEIGAGFRLSELVASTGARVREVGATNRTHLADYEAAVRPGIGCVLKVHPSNYWVSGFTAAVSVGELSRLCRARQVPLVVDVGSGLLTPDEVLPAEPDIAGALRAGADVVLASGDKLLGGPQAGLLLGRADLINQLARHPLARAVRADKLTLAAMEATLHGGPTPVQQALHVDPDRLRARTAALGAELDVAVVPHEGRVGGGGGAGVPLPGWALHLPTALAAPLRTGSPAVLTRVHDGACLLDLRCIPESQDQSVLHAVQQALEQQPAHVGATAATHCAPARTDSAARRGG
ncbi:MAG TPA: L-seryl-tRNA(Sec) selenium transferase [Beutenbergiaceae bacterium]|nr:L-seryl-tRNA(Sec) selenium transferase [Beutenbergiaceae bacterium]